MKDSEPRRSATSSNSILWFSRSSMLNGERLRPQLLLLSCSLIVGVIIGLAAIAFVYACQCSVHVFLHHGLGFHPSTPANEYQFFPDSADEFRPWLLLVIPSLGGLLSGILVYSFAPEAEGHGTDAAIAAYHDEKRDLKGNVSFWKLIASALTIGSGGSGGREGPIVLIGASISSWFGKVFRLLPEERKTLMAAGMAAGVAAIFHAPLAGTLFAAEVLYLSIYVESKVIIPAGLASVMASCTFGLVFGFRPLYEVPIELCTSSFNNPLHLVWYTLLALLMVVMARFFIWSFHGLTNAFHHLPVRCHFKPAIGAFLTGMLALGLLASMYLFYPNRALSSVKASRDVKPLDIISFGYGAIQDTFFIDSSYDNKLYLAMILIIIAVGKIVATSLTLGSGGSGGVFGPSMVIGGCSGGALGFFLQWIFPNLVPHPGSFVLVGMAGFFTAAARTPLSSLVIVSEMTGCYDLILPTLWACTLAFLLSPTRSIFGSQRQARTDSRLVEVYPSRPPGGTESGP